MNLSGWESAPRVGLGWVGLGLRVLNKNKPGPKRTGRRKRKGSLRRGERTKLCSLFAFPATQANP
jgi:hypothetical protein